MGRWLYSKNPPEFEKLHPRVKDKALEIAQKLTEEKNIARDKALKKAIKQAEEWFYNTQG